MSTAINTNIPERAVVAQRLAAAWQQLAGTPLQFVQAVVADGAATDLFAMTPLHVLQATTTGGIALRISAAAATRLAASMFGESPDAIDDEQRNDVCAELSNILCSCVTPLFGSDESVELGVTMNVKNEEFSNILDHNEIMCLYRADSADGGIALAVVESFATKGDRQAPLDEMALPTMEEKVGMKFLIVDDSKAIQTIVRRAVEKTGLHDLEFKTASNGSDALKITDTWLPDMVITDWHMPGMTGIELIKTLKSKFSGLKVGFVTTESSSKNLEEARNAGAAFVMRKPFADDELAKAVLDALEKVTSGNVTVEPVATVRSSDQATLQKFFSNALALQVSMASVTACPLNAIPTPWAIGLYAHAGRAEVHGFCVLDRAAIILLGATLSKQTTDAISRHMAAGDASQPLYDKAATLLASGTNVMFVSDDNKQLVLARNQLVQQPPEKLIEIMNRCRSRSDFSISHSGLPAGRITIITR